MIFFGWIVFYILIKRPEAYCMFRLSKKVKDDEMKEKELEKDKEKRNKG